MNLHTLEALMKEAEEQMSPSLEKTASEKEDVCQEARKIAHALRHAPLTETVDFFSAFKGAEKVAASKAREYFGAKPEVFKDLDWEDGLLVLSGGRYEF